ncbi:MAG: hypothetical protein H0U59_12195 [Gemmatimonadaceae bacterium]|nr:hypothetical protein [Gemmatimonadaceae bacterium]
MDVGAAARARRGINKRGHLISFRRMTTSLPQTASNTANVKAVVEGYAPDELVNGITSGTRHVIVSKLDLIAASYPVPPVKGDRIYLGTGYAYATTIKSVDEDHREYNGCYDIVTEGK